MSFIFFFFLSLSRILLLQAKIDECPKIFACANTQGLKFPFTRSENPECGLFLVHGCDDVEDGYLEIQLNKNGTKYPLLDISQSNTIHIKDQSFEKLLNSKQCESFNNMSFPTTPYVSFRIISNIITIFKCNDDTSLTAEEAKNTQFNYTACPAYNIYYNANDTTTSPPLSQCSLLQLPSNSNPSLNNSDIFSILNATFHLQLTVLGDCFDCYYDRSECVTDDKGEYLCKKIGANNSTAGGNNSKLDSREIGLLIGGGLGILMAVLSACIICRQHYRRKYGLTVSKHVSSHPSSRSNPEEGTLWFGVPIFSYNELEEATNNFDSEKELGDGGYGTVYYGKLRDGREVAVKRLYEHNYKKVKQFMNEVEILTRLHHRNLVSLYGCTSQQSRELLLVYEYIANGTVADHIHGERATSSPLSWAVRMSIAIETASALAYLHKSDIVHRDVKTNNILVDNNFVVKVADFGLSRLFPNDVTHVSTAPQGTPGYVDPEYYKCYQLTDKSDVYSFGVVLIELVSSLPAVDITRDREEINLSYLAIERIKRGAYHELVDASLGYKADEEIKGMTIAVANLAFRCLQNEKELRPSMNEALKELMMIQGGECKYESVNEGYHDSYEVFDSENPVPPSPECYEMGLLKNIQPSASPISVIRKWNNVNTSVNEGYHDSYEVFDSENPVPPSPECYEMGLLKNIQPSASPISVIRKWNSVNTTSSSSLVHI